MTGWNIADVLDVVADQVPDALAVVHVLGLPDDRLGERVTAAIKVTHCFDLDIGALTALVRDNLAGYKVPRQITAVSEIQRGPNGKADVPAVRAAVEMTLAS